VPSVQRITLEQEIPALLSRHGSTHSTKLAAPLVPAAPGSREPLRADAGLIPAERPASGDLPRRSSKRLEEATRADLEAFLGDLLRRRAPATAATRYKVLRILYRWLEGEEEIEANPMARMKPPIIPEQPVPVVPEDGLRRLLAVCAGKDFEARRDTAIITLLLDTGARSGEFAGLTLSTWTCCWSSARVAESGHCRSAERRPWRWTATCGRVPGTRWPTLTGCGSASMAG
jgi:hypothetical protein